MSKDVYVPGKEKQLVQRSGTTELELEREPSQVRVLPTSSHFLSLRNRIILSFDR